MNDILLIAEISEYLPPDLLKAIADRLARKKPETLKPTPDEEARFDELWKLRATFTKRPGDPRKTALEAFCRRIREKPADQDEIKHGIRQEYGSKRDDPSKYCQFTTFMMQRRWENYDWAAVKAAEARRQNVVPIKPIQHKLPDSHWSVQYDRERQARLQKG